MTSDRKIERKWEISNTMINFKALVVKYLREVADKIDYGNCDLTEKEAMDV